MSCGRSYGTGKIPTEGEVDDAPVDRPKALNLRQAPGDEEEEDGKQDGISNEIRQKLARHKPASLGQAARLDGMTPAALMLLLAHLKKGAAAKSA